MARKPTDNLQGYGQTSTPSATPIDTFIGAPRIPQVTPATQLADALGTLSSSVAKEKSRKKVERQELEAKKAEGYAARFQGEQGEFLDSVRLGKIYADLSETVVATIVENKYNNEYYQSTLDKLSKLDDDVKVDVVELERLYDNLFAEANEATAGMDFVNAGAANGVKRAIDETRREFSEFRDTRTRDLHKENTEADVYRILSNAADTDEGMVAAVKSFSDLYQKNFKTSPLTKEQDEQLLVDAAISFQKENPQFDSTFLIESIPALMTDVTMKKLVEAVPIIGEKSLKQKEQAHRERQLNLREYQTTKSAEWSNLMIQNSEEGRKKLEKILHTPLPENATLLEREQYSWQITYIPNILDKKYVSGGDSQVEFSRFKTSFSTAAYTGNFEGFFPHTGLTLKDGQLPTIDEIALELRANPNLNQEDTENAINSIGTVLERYSNYNEGSLKDYAINRFKGTLSNDEKSLLKSRGILNPLEEVAEAYASSFKFYLDEFVEDSGNMPLLQEFDRADGIRTKALNEATSTMEQIKQLAVAADDVQTIEQLIDDIQLQVGDTVESTDADGNIATFRYNGGGEGDNNNYTLISSDSDTDTGSPEEEETDVDPKYAVTKPAEQNAQRFVSGVQGANRARILERQEEAIEKIFDEETATLNLGDDMLSTLNSLVKRRYERRARLPGKNKGPKITEDTIIDLVLDALEIAGLENFSYGGDDTADTAGEIAVKKLVDSLMQQYGTD